MLLRCAVASLALPLLLTAADPAKPIVRYTPMEEAPRSVYVPLGNKLHLAFDMDLLRVHTAWSGDGLQLNGTPHTGNKTPFVSTIQGNVFFDSRPLFPWSVGDSPELFQTSSGQSQFRGVRQFNGQTSFSFEIPTDSGTPVKITQSVRSLDRLQFGFGTVFEIGPCDETIWHAVRISPEDPEMVITNDGTIAHSRGNVDPDNGTRWFAVNSDGPAKLVTKTAASKYTIRKNISNGGASDLVVENFDESLTYLFLKIPPHKESVSFRLITALHSFFSSEGPYETTANRALSDLQTGTTSVKTDAVSVERITADGMKIRPPRGDEYYAVESFPLPPEVELKVTGMNWLPNGDLAVCTWPGEIWIVEHPSGDVADVTYRLFAEGLNEPMGLAVVDGEIVVAQKPELTRVLDTNGDGHAETWETINNDWDYTGNYDAFVFGPAVDSTGNLYVTSPGQRARQDVKYAGWAIQISPDGSTTKGIGSGQRVPNGVGIYGPDNDLFATDNQGNWIGACKLNHIRRDGFYGYPAATPAPPEMWDAPPDDFTPPAIWFPRSFAPSVSGIVTVPTDGFGPFGGQMLAADFQNAVVLRVQLEKVNGEWQGAVFPFMKGFESGANRMAFDTNGRLYVGGVKNKAWAASAPYEQSLERVSWTGEMPFAVKEVHARPDGFELVFTKPQVSEFAEDPESYFVSQFNYRHHQTYGSPEFDHDGNPGSATEITAHSATLSADGLNVQLKLDGLKPGYVTRFRIPDLESTDGDLLWHDEFFYTLNAIPGR